MLVYIIRNIVNGKLYVGVTKRSLSCRWAHHIYYAQRHESKTAFARAIREYGPDKFECRELDIADSWDALLRKEIMWIEFFDCLAPKGYNLTKGGEGTLGLPVFLGRHHSEEAKQKMRQAHLGKRPSEESRRKMSASRTGRPCPWLVGKCSEKKWAHIRKLQQLLTGRPSKLRGRTLPPEHRDNLRAAHKRRQDVGWRPSELTRQRQALGIKRNWASLTPEQRADRGRKLSAGWARRREALACSVQQF